MTTMTTTEARAAMHDLLERVARGDEVTITRHGEPVAVVIRPDALRSRRAEGAFAKAAEIRKLLDEGRTRPLRSLGAISPGRADELVAELRADRDHD